MIRNLAIGLLAAASWAVEPLVNTSDGVAIHGYDPVSYTLPDGPRPGSAELTVQSGGHVYRFATAANRTAFTADPARYLPAYGGWCAYAMADGEFVDVDPKTFTIIDGRVFLFYNGWLGNTLKSWKKDEARLKTKADAAWVRVVAQRGGK